jgi:hypothetical protein
VEIKYKPRDMVLAPGGRAGTVVEILPGHQRLVDIPGVGKQKFKTDDLTLLHSAKPRPWKDRVL